MSKPKHVPDRKEIAIQGLDILLGWLDSIIKNANQKDPYQSELRSAYVDLSADLEALRDRRRKEWQGKK